MPCESERDPCLVDASETHQLGPQLRAQPGGLLVGVHDQQRVPSGRVSASQAGGGRLGLLTGAGVDEPALLVVLAEHALVAVAQPQRRLAAPTRATKRRASASS